MSTRIEQCLKRARDAVSDSITHTRRGIVYLKEKCLFCRCTDTLDNKYQRGNKLISGHLIFRSYVSTNNKWAEKMMARIRSVHDLLAADAVHITSDMQ